MDIDLRRYPPTADDFAEGFLIAGREIGPALQKVEEEHGPTVWVAAFVMLADLLNNIGVGEEKLVQPARQGSRLELQEVQ